MSRRERIPRQRARLHQRGRREDIRCPVLLAHEEADPLAATPPAVNDALERPKTLVRLLTVKGAGHHTAIMPRCDTVRDRVPRPHCRGTKPQSFAGECEPRGMLPETAETSRTLSEEPARQKTHVIRAGSS